MRILIPNHAPLEGTGSGTYAMNTALELWKAGHQVMVLTPEHKPIDGYPFPVRTIIFKNGKNNDAELGFNFPCFTTHPRSTNTFYDLTDVQIEEYIKAWRSAMKVAIESFNPDVIHAHHVWVIPFIVSETALPYVITCHGTDLMGFRNDPRYRELALAGAKNAYAIIAISRQIQSEAMNTYRLSQNKVPLIWNGFNPDQFKLIPNATKKAVLNELGLMASEKPLIGFVGKFTDFKGIDVLLNAAAIYEKELPGIRTLLIGDGVLWNDMHALAKRLDLRGIEFLGEKPPPVARIFNATDICVVPSRAEPFGLVAIEALACGTPVIATNKGGLPDFINDKVGALISVDDPDSLAKAIINGIRNNIKTTKGTYAREYAYENFTWKKQVRKMMELYKSAMLEFAGSPRALRGK
uniref:Glycosyltransferase involved in cell wall bisynthesis n=1 Tax=Candidatus Kentrum sp. MB TaxID=2138164 RepID=A0A451BGN3_9GAMM|nr:MAG: Glycosyltransferase involved in cell wall bisynthesis [Candidatus Kentron sp. MB]VFK35701.1 MAG: Glycosyltransferase involved in cell wall bisynthesis [Candidatus Kentron sp. MB]VFK77441.1 MAG: Glycosyltransferase involved in cell wall bisynthesis [Candidatus Kentron sp. MB]